MNLVTFFDEIFDVLEAAGIGLTIPDDGPGVRASPPAPYVQLPTLAYQDPGPGLHRIPDLELSIVFGQANNTQVFRTALAYASPAGPLSVRAALHAHDWVSVGTVYVTGADPFLEALAAGNPLIAYTFHLDVTGG